MAGTWRSDLRRPVVLVVDDDEAVRTLIATAIAGAGYSVLTARDGRQALSVIRARDRRRSTSYGDNGGTPDLILLDLEMPGLDGHGFVDRYRALSTHGHAAPIVVISAAPDASVRAAQLSAVDVIVKPFDLDELIDCVHRHLIDATRRARRARRAGDAPSRLHRTTG